MHELIDRPTAATAANGPAPRESPGPMATLRRRAEVQVGVVEAQVAVLAALEPLEPAEAVKLLGRILSDLRTLAPASEARS